MLVGQVLDHLSHIPSLAGLSRGALQVLMALIATDRRSHPLDLSPCFSLVCGVLATEHNDRDDWLTLLSLSHPGPASLVSLASCTISNRWPEASACLHLTAAFGPGPHFTVQLFLGP